MYQGLAWLFLLVGAEISERVLGGVAPGGRVENLKGVQRLAVIGLNFIPGADTALVGFAAGADGNETISADQSELFGLDLVEKLQPLRLGATEIDVACHVVYVWNVNLGVDKLGGVR